MNKTQSASVLVVCPAYNSAKHLPELIRRTHAVCGAGDFIVVDDGSLDNTLNILRSLETRHLHLKKNHGKGAALKTGYHWAAKRGYHAVLTLDSDLQHAPEDIPAFLQKNKRMSEAVLIGYRRRRHNVMPMTRQLSNNLTSLIISIFSGKHIRDAQCGFRLLPLRLLRYAPAKSRRFLYESETLFMLGACRVRISEVPISVIYNDSESHINPLIVILKFIRLFWRRLWY